MASPIQELTIKARSPTERGPLRNLDKNKYKSAEQLRYPLDLKSDIGKHYLKFNINIPEKSQYRAEFKEETRDAQALSVADRNRAFSGDNPDQIQQLAGSQDPFGPSALAGGLVVGVGSLIGKASKITKGGARASGAVTASIASAAVGAGVLAFLDVQRKTRRLAQSICIYVPDTVQQTQAMAWGKVSLTSALGNAGFAAQAAQAVTGSDLSDERGESVAQRLGAGRAPNTYGQAEALGGVTGEAFGRAAIATGQFGGGIDKVTLASAGYALNPQNEILFESIDNRTFQFDFKFAPRSQDEAKEVLNIIKAFRYHAAPELVGGAGGGRYFIPPSEFDIGYYYGDTENEALHKFSTCVLQGIDVNYSNGNFATYDDGVPVEIGMTLRFMEVEILHKKLIDEGY